VQSRVIETVLNVEMKGLRSFTDLIFKELFVILKNRKKNGSANLCEFTGRNVS
jgi:hypothetical protein